MTEPTSPLHQGERKPFLRSTNNFEDTMNSSFAPPNDLFEMELLGDDRFYVAVPVCADIELKKRILGAVKSYFHGGSVDHLVKRYGGKWNVSHATDDQRFVVHTLRSVRRRVSETLNSIAQGRPRPDHSGLLAAEVAMMRLEPSFRSAMLLISQAHAFEATAIIRMILEQVAWAYAVHDLTDHQAILRVSPTAAISRLKGLDPFAGPVYGALSKSAHIDPALSDSYFHATPDGTVTILRQMTDASFVALGYLLVVLSLFERVVHVALSAYVDRGKESRFIDRVATLSEVLDAALRTLKQRYMQLADFPDTLFERSGTDA